MVRLRAQRHPLRAALRSGSAAIVAESGSALIYSGEFSRAKTELAAAEAKFALRDVLAFGSCLRKDRATMRCTMC